MSERALRKVSFVLYILNAPTALRADILSTASATLLKLFGEIVLNIIAGNLNGRDFVQKYKTECKTITKTTQSVKRKRETILSQSKEFYLELALILKQYA